jgi:hypothetical protein
MELTASVNIISQTRTRNAAGADATASLFLVTEFYAKGEDSGMPNHTGAGWLVHTQDDRGLFYEDFILALLESRACVGWQWFKYQDNDPDDPHAEASNRDSNKGIVDLGRLLPRVSSQLVQRLAPEPAY